MKPSALYTIITIQVFLATDEASGNSVFFTGWKGDVFHTYSTYARGGEQQLSAFILLDWTPGGRMNRAGEKSYRLGKDHDKYDAEGFVKHRQVSGKK